MMETHAYPAVQNTSGVHRLLGQLVVARNPILIDENKWIIIISGISGPATLGIAQMLTGCMYEEFTINSVPADDIEQQKINSEVDYYRKKIKEGLPPGLESGIIPYDSLSETLLKQLLSVAKKSNGEVNALVYVDVYYPPRRESRYSNDERKVMGWGFADIAGFLRTKWANPNGLKCQFE